MGEVPATATWLGRAGVLPFCAGPLLILLDSAHASVYAQSLALYALAILCFLVGSWWGMALLRQRAGMLIASNVMVIAAVAGVMLLSPGGALLWLAALLVAAWRIEKRHPLFAAQPGYYATLRRHLTLLAAGSLCAAALMV